MNGSPADATTSAPRGAYGVRISGLEDSAASLIDAPEHWPHLAVHRSLGPTPVTRPFHLDDDVLELRTADSTGEVGGIRLTRQPLEVWFSSPGGFGDAEILHPDLGVLGAVINNWSGRDSVHAGAVVTEGGAWAVLGEREAGKSSLMAQLAAAGYGVLADDIVVIDELGRALAGPRCVDLREGAAAHLGLGTDIGMVGARRRWRLHLPEVPPAVELRGWILPEWGDRIEFDTIPVARRPASVFGHRYLHFLPPPRPAEILKLAAMPFVVFRRPRDWDVAKAATAALMERLDSM